jgi:uncharacterized protein YihD (DUF1040 family)
MRDPKRIYRIIARLWAHWQEHPDLRLCQLVWNLASPGVACPEFFYVEDDVILKALIAAPTNKDEGQVE